MKTLVLSSSLQLVFFLLNFRILLMCKKHSHAKEKCGAYEQHYLSFISMEMFQIDVLMTNSSSSDCSGILLGLLGMNQTSCSYDSFTAPWKLAEKKVGITVDTKLNIIQQCSLITNKATSMLNYIMKTMTTRPFITLYQWQWTKTWITVTNFGPHSWKRSWPSREVEGDVLTSLGETKDKDGLREN